MYLERFFGIDFSNAFMTLRENIAFQKKITILSDSTQALECQNVRKKFSGTS